MANSICIYLHAHQPYRLTKLNYFELGKNKNYFLGSTPYENEEVIEKVSKKSYIPTNKLLIKLISQYKLKVNLSITGVLIEQLQEFAPKTLKSFIDLYKTGELELVPETYYHSLASEYSLSEFCEQIQMQKNLLKNIFGQKEFSIFRNTELIYNDYIGQVVQNLGFKSILAEGWDGVLSWRSANFLYNSKKYKLKNTELKIINNFNSGNKIKSEEIKLLLKNYKLSDDIAFRFSNTSWEEHPLSAEKFLDWVESSPGEVVNLFMDYETFGEHQWEDTGIFEFLENLARIAKKRKVPFMSLSEAAEGRSSAGELSFEKSVSWADLERDLSAWTGNKMQDSSLKKVYSLEKKLIKTAKEKLPKTISDKVLDIWRRLQTSDHFYYMSTKFWSDGDVHKYFSPYDSPYNAFINYMNVLEDFEQQLNYNIKKYGK